MRDMQIYVWIIDIQRMIFKNEESMERQMFTLYSYENKAACFDSWIFGSQVTVKGIVSQEWGEIYVDD